MFVSVFAPFFVMIVSVVHEEKCGAYDGCCQSCALGYARVLVVIWMELGCGEEGWQGGCVWGGTWVKRREVKFGRGVRGRERRVREDLVVLRP